METIEIETEGTDCPTCPKCGKQDQDWYDGIEQPDDGDEWEAYCGSCSAEYKIKFHMSFYFDTVLCDE